MPNRTRTGRDLSLYYARFSKRPYAVNSNPAAYDNGASDFLTNNAVPSTDASSPSGWEYNMLRWLKREGYDVTYWGLDDFNVPELRQSSLNANVQQITNNVLARFRQGASPHPR